MKALLPLVALSCACCLPASAVFDEAWQETITGSSAICSPLGDVDGDGDLDLFLAVHLGPCEVWLNDGAGNFTNSGQSIAGSISRTGVALADLDGDPDLDVVLPTNDSSFPSEVWKNNGAGVFSNSGQALGTGCSLSVALEDVDGDGDKDAVVGTNNTMPNRLLLNNGSGTFAASDAFGTGNVQAIAVGDLNGSGGPDVFVGDYGAASSVWLKSGANWSSPARWPRRSRRRRSMPTTSGRLTPGSSRARP